eukprot:scaffold389_cov62-Cyclotella_meneghiniana.AAC.4
MEGGLNVTCMIAGDTSNWVADSSSREWSSPHVKAIVLMSVTQYLINQIDHSYPFIAVHMKE